jgi:hypothetical protein
MSQFAINFVRSLVALLAGIAAAPAPAAIPVKIYAQELVDRTVARYPDLLVVVMHVTLPKSTGNVIIASNIGRIGKPADEDDLRVISTGKPNLEVGHGGRRYEVELVLRDAAGDTLGALGLVWPYRTGDDPAAFQREAEKIRDALARRILNAANLMDSFPFEPLATTRTGAQKLVEEMAAKYPEITALALRAPTHGEPGLAVLGSTFGRHGKKADADDMKIFGASEPATGLYSSGKRFGVDMQLHDASGSKIGTMNVGYGFKAGENKAALLARALALRDELQKRIPSAEALDELDP